MDEMKALPGGDIAPIEGELRGAETQAERVYPRHRPKNVTPGAEPEVTRTETRPGGFGSVTISFDHSDMLDALQYGCSFSPSRPFLRRRVP